uniref:Uncharacterized protein n=1 Tax=Arundo donax TaxID=35708 RepID=A0A0A9A7R6_ARUDO
MQKQGQNWKDINTLIGKRWTRNKQ